MRRRSGAAVLLQFAVQPDLKGLRVIGLDACHVHMLICTKAGSTRIADANIGAVREFVESRAEQQLATPYGASPTS